MKKHDEGYALVLVVVVIAVLGLVVIPSVLQGAVNNVESQRASVDRMIAKYEAQGEIEETVAKIQAELHLGASEKPNGANAEGAVKAWFADKTQLAPFQENITVSEEDGTFSCIIPLSDENKVITCELELTGTVKRREGDLGYKVTAEKLFYKSYDISIGGAGE